MYLNAFKLTLSFVLFISICFFTSSAQAMTPEEFCKMHSESGASDTCKPCGDKCAVLVGLTTICKDCTVTETQCEMTECENCPDYPACVE